MNHRRKYGEKESRPIPVWNGIFEHYDRIGDALWEFEKCIDWITDEQDGVGIVLGGKPVKVSEIVAAIKGSKKETVRRHMDALEKENFIRRRRTPYGHVIEVLNSHKFGIWKKEKPQNDVSLTQEKPIHGSEKPISGSEKPKNNTNKEDAAVTQQKDAAVRGALRRSPLWEVIGVKPESLPAELVELSEGLYVRKGEQPLFDFMGIVMDVWQSQGHRIPRALAQAKAALRDAPVPAEPFPVAETEPWGAGVSVR